MASSVAGQPVSPDEIASMSDEEFVSLSSAFAGLDVEVLDDDTEAAESTKPPPAAGSFDWRAARAPAARQARRREGR